MLGRFLAICGWVASRVESRIAATLPGRRIGPQRVMFGLLALVGILSLLPIVLAYAQAQPADVEVEALRLGTVTDASDWVRLRGKVVPLEMPPTTAPSATEQPATEQPATETGAFGILVDAEDPLEAIIVTAPDEIAPAEATMVTGRLRSATVVIPEDLPVEATVAGTPPNIVLNRVVDLDEVALPERVVLWPLTVLGAFVIGLLAIGIRAGYPVFRSVHETNVLAQPLAPGDTLPVAVGGRIGPHDYKLADPAGAVVSVEPGPRGGVLTVQVLGDGRSAPPPVEVGGGWTDGRVGYVHTIDETVPALAVRSERADAVLLFARTTERDRAAALVAVER